MKHCCRFCHQPLNHTFCDLGLSPLANAYLEPAQSHQEKLYPLHALVCSSCSLVQLPALHTPNEIFEEYAYFSSCSSSWLEHSQAFTQMICKKLALNTNSQVIEIASNDGYLLQFFKEQQIPVLGIEPAKNVADAARAKGIETLDCFFGTELVETMEQKADLLIGNNVLAHVPNLNDFVKAMKCVLKKEGVISLEFPHVLHLIEQNQFDTIYHEHFSYFSLLTLQKVFAAHGLCVFDVDVLDTHGGSLRLYCKHEEDESHKITSSVEACLGNERQHKLDQLATYTQFSEKIARVKQDLLAFLEQAKQENKVVVGYGAPAKGNTLLNYCGIRSSLLPFTVDKSRYKQGKLLPGTHIPIFPPQKIEEQRPDYLLILPWNLKEEITQQMAYMRSWGAKFVLPIPKLEVV